MGAAINKTAGLISLFIYLFFPSSDEIFLDCGGREEGVFTSHTAINVAMPIYEYYQYY